MELKLSSNPDYHPIMQVDPYVSSNAPSLGSCREPGRPLFDFCFLVRWGSQREGCIDPDTGISPCANRMAWCRQATSHYLSQCWPRSMSSYGHNELIHSLASSSGRGPTGLRARVRNRSRLENRSHVVPKTGFQDGGDRTRIFTHKINILA